MLCRFCIDNVLMSGKSWGYHRKKVEKRERAALEKCVFCSTLIKDAGLAEHGKAWPLYRWSMRFPGRTREIIHSIVITFRLIPEEDSKDFRPGFAASPDRVFYMFPEEELGIIPSIEDVGRSTNLDSAGAQVKSWVQLCDNNHEGCSKQRIQQERYGSLPTRLLDVGTERIPCVKLIETKKTKVRGPYVSLSHCWGRILFITLTPENLESFKDGIGWEKLSRNFQEAITLTRFLGISYIWIDSLCIIQGPKGDFPAEAPFMHQYYRNAYCNIAAADASNSAGGLFRRRNPTHILPDKYSVDDKSTIFGDKKWRIVNQDIWHTQLLKTVIYTRGWVFQERMLAPRIIHFARDQIFWDCPEMSACEAFPSGLPQPLDTAAATDRHWRGRLQETGSIRHHPLAGASDDSLEQFWISAVRNYTSCDLTNGNDKLIALWGIAKLVRDALEEEYGAGLWAYKLEEQLAWRVSECTLDERPVDLRDNPSWSWASMNGTIELANRVAQVAYYERTDLHQTPKLVEERYYVVTDHHGEPVSFQLIYELKAGTPSGSTTDGATGSKRPKPGRGYSASQNDPDRQPRLGSKSIEIEGYVGHAALSHNGIDRWTLSSPEEGRGLINSNIEVFPDTKPKAPDTDFIVLSASKTPLDISMPRLDALGFATAFQYSGVGIILLRTDESGHYERSGAFRFRNVSEEMWQILRPDTGNPDSFLGDTKFWLD
ncbi:HET-domain-containing protein [Lophium mytilinum]|uniref:HET-domain-containing protein n=1 Tax=Lophium mytilinum TaxID=390894 RepID=A0A6A6R0L8_9PEZI|nr:HET-domain-containing protein [Lophium mytilinum]